MLKRGDNMSSNSIYQENERLIALAQQGDLRARSQVYEANIGLVYMVLERFKNSSYEYEDLFQVDGKSVPVDPYNPRVVPEIMEPGRTMVPLRFVSEALGCTVDWNPATGEITIKY
jgi:hypothetical protein